ncbi:HAD-IA family hydrolase [Embleya sp. NPDC008237]|uniref:HAD-IA family hydrolase n=1 Tax=Embleya sp. NPDC008237 TaxID=3363978 RepID=UPI0036E9A892
MTTTVRGLLVDLDGVVRLWNHSATHAEQAFHLPPGALRALAYDDLFDLAHVGVLTHQQWVADVRARATRRFGQAGDHAVTHWAADRGTPDPAMADLLRRARAAGLRIGALTNNTTAVEDDLRLHGLRDLFDIVADSATTHLTKPSPRAYTHALELLDLPAASVVFTDDNPTNVRAAAWTGLRAHHHTTAAAFEAFLTEAGVHLGNLAPPAPDPLGTQPPPGHAESDTHTTIHVRYLATARTAPRVAADLLASGTATTAHPIDPHTVTARATDDTITTVRLLPVTANPDAAAGHPGAWLPYNPDPGPAEHLPPWLATERALAALHAEDLLTRTGWALTHVADRHRAGDALAAADALDQARHALTLLGTLLARHQPHPWPDATATRYLPASHTAAFLASHAPDPTTALGLAAAVRPVTTLIPLLRRACADLLDVDHRWSWDHTARALAAVLGETPDLSPAPGPEQDVLYTAELAAAYDTHRPVPTPMAEALHAFADTHLAGRDVVELGAGTGRVTTHLAAGTRTYTALETSAPMAARLAARELAGVRALLADAIAPPLPDASADVVLEHEVLLFTPDPLLAVDRALRLLRPGGCLIRLLLHPVGPDPLQALDVAYRCAAFANHPMPLFHGKGTDHRVTAHLTALSLPTTTATLAEYTIDCATADALAALAERAWPYQHQTDTHRHRAGTDAAHRAARALPDHVRTRFALRALTTFRGPR